LNKLKPAQVINGTRTSGDKNIVDEFSSYYKIVSQPNLPDLDILKFLFLHCFYYFTYHSILLTALAYFMYCVLFFLRTCPASVWISLFAGQH